MQQGQDNNAPASPLSSSRMTQESYTPKPLAESGFLNAINTGNGVVENANEYIRNLRARLDSRTNIQGLSNSGVGVNSTPTASNTVPTIPVYNSSVTYTNTYPMAGAPSISNDNLKESTPALRALAENSSALIKLSASPRGLLNNPVSPSVNVNAFGSSGLSASKETKSFDISNLGYASSGLGEYKTTLDTQYTNQTRPFDLQALLAGTGVSTNFTSNRLEGASAGLKSSQTHIQNLTLNKETNLKDSSLKRSTYGYHVPTNPLYTPGGSGMKAQDHHTPNVSVMLSPPLRRDALETHQNTEDAIHEPSVTKKTLYTIENKGSVSLRASREFTAGLLGSKITHTNNQSGLLRTPERQPKTLSEAHSPLDELRYALKNDNVQISKIIIETVENGNSGGQFFHSPVKVEDLRDDKGNGGFDIVVEEKKLTDNYTTSHIRSPNVHRSSHNDSYSHDRLLQSYNNQNSRNSSILNSNSKVADKISGLGERLKGLDILLSPGGSNAYSKFDGKSSVLSKRSENTNSGLHYRSNEIQETKKEGNLHTPVKNTSKENASEKKAAPVKSPNPIKEVKESMKASETKSTTKTRENLLPRIVFVVLVLILLGVLSLELMVDTEAYEEKMDALIL